MAQNQKNQNMNTIYFGVSGITSASANHIANIAKEYYTPIVNELTKLSFVSKSLQLLGTKTETKTTEGTTTEELDDLLARVPEITACKSLIAWLREAIKEKENATKAIRQDSPDYPEKEPEYPKQLSEEEVISTWTIGQREKYLSLEATAAVLGQLVHNEGSLSRARREMSIMQAVAYNECGRDTVIARNSLSASKEIVDERFFTLQRQHRTVQAELNGMKRLIEQAIKADFDEKLEQYQKDLAAYNAARKEYVAAFAVEKQKKLKEVEDLKILIPAAFKAIYDKLSSL